jgi:hypothetical protein
MIVFDSILVMLAFAVLLLALARRLNLPELGSASSSRRKKRISCAFAPKGPGRRPQDMWSELLKAGEDPTTHRFQISDTDGNLLLSVPFTEVLQATQKPTPRSPTVSATINLIEVTQTLTAALNQQIQDTRTIIEIS